MTRVVSMYFNRAADILNLDPNYRLILGLPGRELAVNLPVEMDSGEIQIFPGYRVQHHVAMGPMHGGLRYRPDLTLDDLRALALWATLTSAVADVPFGGSMGGIICDPNQLSIHELERLTRRYVVEILDIIGTERDILAPDFSTDQQVMAWIMDTYSMHARQTVTAIVTGKPLELGGSHGSHESVGYGVWCLLDATFKHLGNKPVPPRVAIQGAGRRGGSAAKLLHQAGYKVIAITDSGGGVYHPDGLDVRMCWNTSPTTAHWPVTPKPTPSPTKNCSPSTAMCSSRLTCKTRSRPKTPTNSAAVSCVKPRTGQHGRGQPNP
ncbi:Glu/Leu/Phe/Val dehydrogenase [Chloracidobacterium sp. E]|nr:Glu/Leu/Phe/Val dehydrogenase [Chloracidobacterium sp. E]